MTDLTNLPLPQRRALDLVREVAREKQCRAFLVGGPVRDLLLSRQVIDIDLTMEEGSSTLARALARRIDGRVRSFPQFLTYKVTADGMPEIDIATARKERYRKPGALPSVTAGRLKDDLLRRDFGINAIAMDLVEGSLHDPAGGAQDLEDGVIRVLHNDSFADDPTRIFRALRLAVRLGFTLEPHTAALMRAAIDAGALRHISRERIWRELFLAMDEEEAPRILFSLRQWGALEILFGTRHDDDALMQHLTAVREQVAANPELDRYVLYTGALLRGDASPVDLEGSGFSARKARNVIQLANELARFIDALAEAESDQETFLILKSASQELLSILGAAREEDSRVVARFREYRNFKLPLRGDELDVPGGPHIAQALERTREAVFTGEIALEQACSFAREKAMQYLSQQQETRPSVEGR